jgi:valyl-tRNA synthetase
LTVLEHTLRLAHPLIPFITEEIWQQIAPLTGKSGKTIMLQPYPVADMDQIDREAVSDIDWVKDFIVGVRKIRSGMNIDPRRTLPVMLQNGTDKDKTRLEDHMTSLLSVGRIESITWLETGDQAPEAATFLVGDMKLLIPLAGLIDKDAENARLTKEIEKKQNELARCEGKLANSSFVDKAPADVVENEKSKLAVLSSALNNLQEQQKRIQSR